MIATNNAIVRSDMIDAAGELLALGFKVVPVPFRQKKCIMDGWPELRLDEHDLADHFAGRCNVGVLLGEPSGWLVDIDLDHPLAVEMAADFLPETGIAWGRASKLRSHLIYRVSAPIKTRQYKRKLGDNKFEMIVEIRSTRSQTVAPGSVHETGEPVRWDSRGEPEVISPGELERAVGNLHEAVLGEIQDSESEEAFSASTERAQDRHEKTLETAQTLKTVGTLEYEKMVPAEVIERCLLRGPNQREATILDLARGLKLNAGLGGRPLLEVRSLFNDWHSRSEPFASRLRSKEENWQGFGRAWICAKYPLGVDLALAAFEQAQDTETPSFALVYESEDKRWLVRTVQLMGESLGVFSLSRSQVALALWGAQDDAKVWERTRGRAGSMLGGLVNDEVLRLVQRGRQGRPGGPASRYEFLGMSE